MDPKAKEKADVRCQPSAEKVKDAGEARAVTVEGRFVRAVEAGVIVSRGDSDRVPETPEEATRPTGTGNKLRAVSGERTNARKERIALLPIRKCRKEAGKGEADLGVAHRVAIRPALRRRRRRRRKRSARMPQAQIAP